MGCDIHIVLERKYGLKWIAVDTFKGHESGFSKTAWASPIATSRNYERFGALANVRTTRPSILRMNDSQTGAKLCAPVSSIRARWPPG